MYSIDIHIFNLPSFWCLWSIRYTKGSLHIYSTALCRSSASSLFEMPHWNSLMEQGYCPRAMFNLLIVDRGENYFFLKNKCYATLLASFCSWVFQSVYCPMMFSSSHEQNNCLLLSKKNSKTPDVIKLTTHGIKGYSAILRIVLFQNIKKLLLLLTIAML